MFDSKRGSRYGGGERGSNGSSQPRAFHLTQPDANMAKIVFYNKEGKKHGRDT